MIRLFEGKEVEGRFKGAWTLFVSGDVPTQQIFSYNNLIKRCSQLYFGADNCSYVNWNTVRECVGFFPIVTVELGDNLVFNDIYYCEGINLVLRIDKLTLGEMTLILENLIDKSRIQLKFDTQAKSYLAPASAFISNWKSAIQEDTELWRQE